MRFTYPEESQMRMVKQETVENISRRYGELSAAVLDIRSEEEALEKGRETGSLTKAGMRDAMSRINRLHVGATEHALYLGSAFSVFLSEVAKTEPETIVSVFGLLTPHLPQIVNGLNKEKDRQRLAVKENKAREIREAAQKLLLDAQKAKNANQNQK